MNHGRDTDITTRFVLTGDLLYLTCLAIRSCHLGKLFVAHLLRQQVADIGFQFDVFAKTFREGQIDHVTRHLVAIRYAGIFLTATASFATSHTDDAFTDPVIQQGYLQLLRIETVKESCIDQVGRLSLHGPVLVA